MLICIENLKVINQTVLYLLKKHGTKPYIKNLNVTHLSHIYATLSLLHKLLLIQ